MTCLARIAMRTALGALSHIRRVTTRALFALDFAYYRLLQQAEDDHGT